LGKEQATQCGEKLKELIGDEKVKFWVSPYLRARMTFKNIAKAFAPDQIEYREEPRLREQDWGNFQNPDEMVKYKQRRLDFGIFYYRLPQGESGADVYDRVSTFLESLFRDFEYTGSAPNVVLVTHGITCRLFLMRFFHWPVDRFQRTWNLENCQIVILDKQEDGSYELTTPLKEDEEYIGVKDLHSEDE
jgi:broad specificity phosphatase PhoE